jgi:hypothetical protein
LFSDVIAGERLSADSVARINTESYQFKSTSQFVCEVKHGVIQFNPIEPEHSDLSTKIHDIQSLVCGIIPFT